jgi:hypothetical protein
MHRLYVEWFLIIIIIIIIIKHLIARHVTVPLHDPMSYTCHFFHYCSPQNADHSVSNVALTRKVTARQSSTAEQLTGSLFTQQTVYKHRQSNVTQTVRHDSHCMRSHVPIKGQPLLEPCTDEKRSIRKVLIRIRIRVYNYKLPYNRDNNGSPFIMDSVRR